MLNISANARKWLVVVATSMALAMIFVDLSALPIALPSIQRELHASQNMLHWIINAYLLSLAVLIILGGKLGDRLGHRCVFVTGSSVFIISSILCALAPSSTWMLAGRIAQGVGGALMMPSATPLFRRVVATNEIGKMTGIYVSIASVFLIIGPTLGGFFTEYLSWRWIFWINFPLAITGITIVLLVVPKESKSTAAVPFDWQGFIWLTICLIAFVYALMEGTSWGWSSPLILSCFAISIITAIIFLSIEKQQQHPFLELSLFKNSYFSSGIFILLIMQCIFMATIFWAIFFQTVLKMSAVKAGMLMLAAQAPIFISSHIAGRLFDRYGPKLPTRLGAVLLTASSLWMAIFCWQPNFWWLFPALILFGSGSPFINLTNISFVITSVPAEKRGMASGVASAVRQVGGSIGLAVLGALISTLSSYQFKQRLTDLPLNHLSLETVLQHTTGNALPVYEAAKYAYTFAFSTMMYVVTFLSLMVLVIARKLPQRQA